MMKTRMNRKSWSTNTRLNRCKDQQIDWPWTKFLALFRENPRTSEGEEVMHHDHRTGEDPDDSSDQLVRASLSLRRSMDRRSSLRSSRTRIPSPWVTSCWRHARRRPSLSRAKALLGKKRWFARFRPRWKRPSTPNNRACRSLYPNISFSNHRWKPTSSSEHQNGLPMSMDQQQWRRLKPVMYRNRPSRSKVNPWQSSLINLRQRSHRWSLNHRRRNPQPGQFYSC